MSFVHTEHEYSAARTEDLIAAIQALATARTVAEIGLVVTRSARRVAGADAATFVLKEGSKCFYAEEDCAVPLWKGRRFSVEVCSSGWVMANRRPSIVEDVTSDESVPLDDFRFTNLRSIAVVPIRTHDPVGAIGIGWTQCHRATPAEMKMLQAIADSASVALENVGGHAELERRIRERTAELEKTNAALQQEVRQRARAEEENRQLSLSDELTGLLNRRGFMLLAAQELKVVERSGRRGLVLYIDLDGLKQTNDTLGHDAGDKLIVAAAQILQRCARDADVIGRLGGDEFAVFMHMNDEGPPIPAIVERLLHASRRAGLSISVGATATQPGRRATLEDLLIVADETMYRGRRARRAQQLGSSAR